MPWPHSAIIGYLWRFFFLFFFFFIIILTPAAHLRIVSFNEIQNNNIIILVRKIIKQANDTTYDNTPALDFSENQQVKSAHFLLRLSIYIIMVYKCFCNKLFVKDQNRK